MKLKVSISEIRRIQAEAQVRIGQGIVNNRFKPASMMLRDELDFRRELFCLSDESFWKEHDKFVEIDWES